METEASLKSQLINSYHNTLELAKGITVNRYQFFDEEINQDHKHFIKRISKDYQTYKRFVSKSNQRSRIESSANSVLETNNEYVIKPHFGYGKDSGKLKLDDLIEESYKLTKKTKTGRGGIRHLTPSPPPVLQKLRTNKNVYTEAEDPDDKLLAYVSLISGKTEEIRLPSFKDCTKGNKRIDSDSETVLNRIAKCQEEISNFEKRINGLEVFCKYNPGVRWKDDKKLLMKLSSNPHNRNTLIKAYNERRVSPQTTVSRPVSVSGRRQARSPSKGTTFQMPLIKERQMSSSPEASNRSELRQEHCFDGFHEAKNMLNGKTLKILNKLRAERPVYLRAKAGLILADNEGYRGIIHSFQKFERIKKTVEKERYSFVVRCKEQVKVYTRLLDCLKKYKGMPTQHMIGFAEAIKELIEGGWTLTRENVEGVLMVFTEEELEDLKELREIVEKYLDEIEDC